MASVLFILACCALALWCIILVLPWQPWRNREAWDAEAITGQETMEDVTVLIPARNEAKVISRTLKALSKQGRGIQVILIDDNSTDDTARVASQALPHGLRVISGTSLPEGWSGKLWALEQGWQQVKTSYVMLLDADIELSEGVVYGLRERIKHENKDLISLMAAPSLHGFWEKLLMPAFVYFFKLLYPFHLSNAASKWVAAAAGGCVMMRAEVLHTLGGFYPVQSALIDDCTLARNVKDAGFRTWMGLTYSVKSIRPYEGLSELWNMVARTAYTQLRYSVILLLVCTALMLLAFWVPVVAAFSTDIPVRILGLGAYGVMVVTFIPTLLYYRLSFGWAFLLPLVAALYLGMTWTSALRYWKGERVRWRGRIQHAAITEEKVPQ